MLHCVDRWTVTNVSDCRC